MSWIFFDTLCQEILDLTYLADMSIPSIVGLMLEIGLPFLYSLSEPCLSSPIAHLNFYFHYSLSICLLHCFYFLESNSFIPTTLGLCFLDCIYRISCFPPLFVCVSLALFEVFIDFLQLFVFTWI